VAYPAQNFGGPKIGWRPKFLTLGEQQYFCLGTCFTKHKMTIYPKNLGD